MDFKNLSEKDERLLCDTVADYFVKNFGEYDGVTENAERYKNSVRFLHYDEFKDVFSRRDPRYVDGDEATTIEYYEQKYGRTQPVDGPIEMINLSKRY